MGKPSSSSPPGSVWTASPSQMPLQEGNQALLWPCLLGAAFPPQRLGLESLIWEGRICFSIGPCERGQKQRAVLVSGQEVFAQPYRQML